jgi:hypothetical protein
MTEYTTTDLQLSAFLKAVGHDLVRADGPPAHRRFVFRDVPAETIAAYHSDAIPVPPRALFAAYRILKRRVFESV